MRVPEVGSFRFLCLRRLSLLPNRTAILTSPSRLMTCYRRKGKHSSRDREGQEELGERYWGGGVGLCSMDLNWRTSAMLFGLVFPTPEIDRCRCRG